MVPTLPSRLVDLGVMEAVAVEKARGSLLNCREDLERHRSIGEERDQ